MERAATPRECQGLGGSESVRSSQRRVVHEVLDEMGGQDVQLGGLNNRLKEKGIEIRGLLAFLLEDPQIYN